MFFWEEGESHASRCEYVLQVVVSLVSLCSSGREVSLQVVNVSTISGGESGESVFLWEGRESITCI